MGLKLNLGLGVRTGARGILRRVLLSGVGSAAIVAVSTPAAFVTSWPKWLSLIIEPISLFLVPGVFFSMVFDTSHDYVYEKILRGSYEFYLLVFYGMLWMRDRAVIRGSSADRLNRS